MEDGASSYTTMVTVVVALPPVLLAVMVKVVALVTAVGVPEIAPVEVGLKFAFEAHPRYCFEKNMNKLPFGAHAWDKWDSDFWKNWIGK